MPRQLKGAGKEAGVVHLRVRAKVEAILPRAKAKVKAENDLRATVMYVGSS
jgi:hypothetical protein